MSPTLENPSLGALSSALSAAGPAMQAVLRMGAGLLFMQHGAQKLFGVLGKEAVPLFTQYGFAGVLEFFGGLLIVVGLAVRPVGALLTLLMLVAYGMAHMPESIWPIVNRGELALLYALIFAYFAGNGAGIWSLDAWLSSRRKS